MKKPKPITEWKLDKKSFKIVKKELQIWFNHIKSFSDVKFTGNKLANIHRCDFNKMDFFYFTDCHDILNEKTESTGIGQNLDVRARKRAKLLAMFISTLLGNDLNRTIKCSHCGYEKRTINGMPNGAGHYVFCPKCGMTTIVTYPPHYDTCINYLKQGLIKDGHTKKNN